MTPEETKALFPDLDNMIVNDENGHPKEVVIPYEKFVEFTKSQKQGQEEENPWLAMAGIFKDDPYFENCQKAIRENRRIIDQECK